MSFKTNRYKDMDKYRKIHNSQKERWRLSTGSFCYPRKSYTDEEDAMILEHSIPDMELGILIQRSVASIQTRRNLLKKEMKENEI